MERMPRTAVPTPSCRKVLRGNFIDVLPVQDQWRWRWSPPIRTVARMERSDIRDESHILHGRSRISLTLKAGLQAPARQKDQGGSGRSMPCRQRPARARIGGTDDALRRYRDRVRRCAPLVLHHFVAARLESLDYVGWQAPLERDLVGQPLMMHAMRGDGLIDRKLQVDAIDDDLQHGG